MAVFYIVFFFEGISIAGYEILENAFAFSSCAVILGSLFKVLRKRDRWTSQKRMEGLIIRPGLR